MRPELRGTFDWNYQELNAIKFTIARRQLPARRKRRRDARRYSRRLPSGSGNNRGGLKLWFHPIPLLDRGILSEFIDRIDHEHPYQWRRQPMETRGPSADSFLRLSSTLCFVTSQFTFIASFPPFSRLTDKFLRIFHLGQFGGFIVRRFKGKYVTRIAFFLYLFTLLFRRIKGFYIFQSLNLSKIFLRKT